MIHESYLDLVEDATIQDYSKKLFGSSYRLVVAAEVSKAEPGVINVPDVAKRLQIEGKMTVVRLELETFAKVGLLMRLPRPRGQRIQEYERMPGTYWQLAAQVLGDLSATVRAMNTGRANT